MAASVLRLKKRILVDNQIASVIFKRWIRILSVDHGFKSFLKPDEAALTVFMSF